MPGGPGSALLDPSFSIPFFGKGFRISNHGTSWNLNRIEKTTHQELDIEFTQIKNSKIKYPEATLRLNTDSISRKLSLEEYSKQYLSEYTSLGFELLGTQNFKQKDAPGFVIDLLHRKQNKKVRQAFFMRDKTVVQITCQDEKSSFSESLIECNRWIKNFTWIEKNPQKSF